MRHARSRFFVLWGIVAALSACDVESLLASKRKDGAPTSSAARFDDAPDVAGQENAAQGPIAARPSEPKLRATPSRAIERPQAQATGLPARPAEDEDSSAERQAPRPRIVGALKDSAKSAWAPRARPSFERASGNFTRKLDLRAEDKSLAPATDSDTPPKNDD